MYNRNFGDRGISYGKWGSKELRLWVSQPRDSHLQQIHIHVNPGVITPLFINRRGTHLDGNLSGSGGEPGVDIMIWSWYDTMSRDVI